MSMWEKVVATVACLSLAVGLVPVAPALAAGDDAVSFSSYSIHPYREEAYGTPPNGIESTDGCHFVIEAVYPGEVEVTDPAAAAASFQVSGTVGTAGRRVISVTAKGAVLSVDVSTDYMPGGELTVEPATIAGATCAGKELAWPGLRTVVPTGLKFHVTDVTVGTATRKASTTIEIDHSAVVRSMNHILWTSNGNSILPGTGTAQTTAAHHHNFWMASLKTSAEWVSTYANALGTYGYQTQVTDDGYGVTITAGTAREGEYLGIYNYDDDFLQADGLTLDDAVSGLSVQVASDARDISARCNVELPAACAYTGTPVMPELVLEDGRYGTLSSGRDYTLECADNVEVGTATVTATGAGAYSGSVTREFRIARPLTKDLFAVDTAAETFKAGPFAKEIRTQLVEGEDYTVLYQDNAFPGTARITISGLGDYMGTLEYSFDILPLALTKDQFSVDTAAKVYTGSQIEPAVTSSLRKGLNYTVSYGGNVNAGTGTLTVQGQGNYGGTLVYEFPIKPAKAKVTSAKPNGKRALKLAWTKTGVKKYQVNYRVKGAKTWKSKSASTNSCKLVKLTSGKKYQVRIVSKSGAYQTTSAVKTTAKVK